MYCVRLPYIINPPVEQYLEAVGDKVRSTISSSSDGAITHILARELGGGPKVGLMMKYLRENFETENRSLERYSVNMPRLEQELAVAKISGSLMEVEDLPEVTREEMRTGLVNRLKGRPSDYDGTIVRYQSD